MPIAHDPLKALGHDIALWAGVLGVSHDLPKSLNDILRARVLPLVEALEKIDGGYNDTDHSRHCAEQRRIARAALNALTAEKEIAAKLAPKPLDVDT